MANIATHGRWCGAKTYLTICRYCSDPVFYFQCNCGSKVFFDDLGDPWPIHRCAEYLATLTPLRFVVDRAYTATLKTNLRRPEASQTVRVDAIEDAKVDDIGVIREILREVDIRAKCGVASDDRVGMAFLGKLASGKYGQITVHTGDLSQENLKSYTFYLETRLIDKLQLDRRHVVSVQLAAKMLPSKGGSIRAVWVCKDIYHP